ncbi:MAG: hypothetical protein ACI4RF_07115 [Eubacterium sp.]
MFLEKLITSPQCEFYKKEFCRKSLKTAVLTGTTQFVQLGNRYNFADVEVHCADVFKESFIENENTLYNLMGMLTGKSLDDIGNVIDEFTPVSAEGSAIVIDYCSADYTYAQMRKFFSRHGYRIYEHVYPHTLGFHAVNEKLYLILAVKK